MTKTFPTLYKKTETGALLQWTISSDGPVVRTFYGQVDGKLQQRSYGTAGMNKGKANETTDEEQAEKEAQAKWNIYRKNKGYFETKEEAMAETLKVRNGGIKPMKCDKYEDRKPTFPCLMQRKLNGYRCTVTRTGEAGNDVIRLSFSGGKEIVTMDHLKSELMAIMMPGEILDGEIYKHGYALNEINSIVKNTKEDEGREEMELHLFDAPTIRGMGFNSPFSARHDALRHRMRGVECHLVKLQLVETFMVASEEEAEILYREFVRQGYEGAIYRQIHMPYEQKRSKFIIKRKDFKDSEFPIVRANAGVKDDTLDEVVSFTCSLPDGETFEAPMMGSKKYRRKLLANPEMWQGKMLTVKYLELSEYGVPQVLKGKGIVEAVNVRDKED